MATPKMLLATLHAQSPIASNLHLEVRAQAFTHPDEPAREFGLLPLGTQWCRIDRVTASAVIFALLIQDMAFLSPRLTEGQARRASDEFLTQFTTQAAFFTNGNWEMGWQKSRHSNTSFGPTWEPATQATFDGGILALDHSRTGILWLEDED